MASFILLRRNMNNKELYKRFIAYLIDYLIVMILVSGLINIKQFNPFYDYMLESNNNYVKLANSYYQMTNMFDRGEENPEDRIAKIKQEGIQNFERNLEPLLLKHMFAFSVKENVDSVKNVKTPVSQTKV